jgi:hypothetical protein
MNNKFFLFFRDYNDTDSTDNEYINSLSAWRYQQLIICIISILISTLLVFGIFIVAAVIIICRIRRNKRQLNLRELRPINELL